MSNIINVSELISHRKITSFQILVGALCFLIVAFDGFDTAAIGFLAPAIRAEWNLGPAELAPLFGVGLAGLMAGAFLFGPLADRIGRKAVLLISVLFFGLACLASSFAPSIGVLVALRFLTGLGLGGAMPNSVTLTSEYCPERHRLFLVTTMFCGFTVGSALGGIASAHLVEAYGWRSVLVVGGVLPLALLPLLAWKLPESARFLVLAERGAERIAATLRRVAPELDYRDARYVLNHPKPKGLPVTHLFRPDLLRGTVLLWFAFFGSLLIIYLLSSWLPTLVKSTGVSLKTASLVTSMFQIGGTLGAIFLGWLMDKYEASKVLAFSYAAAAVFIAAIGSLTASPLLVAIAVFGAGFCVSGGQVGANALTASYYPTDCRATGVAWANGVGRFGSVLGSMGGGLLLAYNLSMPTVFVIVGAPALISATAMALLAYRGHAAVQQEATS